MSRAVMGCVALSVALLVAQGADAQRGKRKRQAPPESPPAQADGGPAGADNPYTDGGGEGAVPDSAAPAAEAEAAPSEGGEAPAAETADDADEADALDDLFGGPDLGPLRERLTSIMDELVQARSRMAVLGRQLFRTRMRIRVDNRAADEQALARITVELDGAPVFRHEGALEKQLTHAFEGFAAPGPHLLTVEVEQRSRASDDYGYTIRHTYRVHVLRGKLTDVAVILDDASDMGEDFPEDHDGEYDVRTRLRVEARDLPR